MYEVKRKRKRGFAYVLILFLCAFSVGLGIGYGSIRLGYMGADQEEPVATEAPEKTMEPDRQAVAQVAEEPVASETPVPAKMPGFLVKEESGRVCVFVLDEEERPRFSHNLSIELDALREEDRKLFRDGIRISSKEELYALMEDFGS